MATPTPPGTIIEALKQGNAVELELVKKMEEGLRFITVGLKRECFNRDDALSELRESLPTIETTVNATQIANIKTKIAQLNQENILATEKIEADARATLLEAMRVSDEFYCQDVARYNKAVARMDARDDHLRNICDVINEMRFDKKPKIRAQLIKGYKASLATYDEDTHAMEEDEKQIDARVLQREKEGVESYCKTWKAALKVRKIWLELLDCCNEVPGN
ncbi:hypothetical protein HBI67_066920 [Parastagonospora nodorum]|nr:hypothetical protein HBI67_066920 [Parastagonospora nodorum]KAH6088176.1 hypothetical protein HBI66_030450 [Parastagonospora nodorum]